MSLVSLDLLSSEILQDILSNWEGIILQDDSLEK